MTLFEIEKVRMDWSLATFKEATAMSSLLKLESEIQEVKQELETVGLDRTHLAEEYADCLMCLFDSAGRAGITPHMIKLAYGKKVTVNQLRSWKKNADNTYSHI